MSTKTHTQAIDTYFGTDLKAGMTWVDGYGFHFTIMEARPHVRSAIVDGFLSVTRDYTRTDLRLRIGNDPSFWATIDNGDEFDIAKA